MDRFKSVVILLMVSGIISLATQKVSAGNILGWGDNSQNEASVPSGDDFKDISAGSDFSLALRADGSVVAWGLNADGQCNVPAVPDFAAVAAGEYHSLLLNKDGSLSAYGAANNNYGQTLCPPGNDYIKIAAGGWHSVALKTDGSIAAWGYSGSGVSTPPSGSNFVAIDAGHTHSIALRANGSLVVWGSTSYNLIKDAPTTSDFKAVAAGGYHCVALKTDGSLVAWGLNTSGQATVPTGHDYVAVAAKGNYSLAIKADGSLVAFGNNTSGQCNVPSSNNIRKIAAGIRHALAIEEIGSLTLTYPNGGEIFKTGTTQTITWTTEGTIPNVAIDYSTNNGVTWIPVSPPNSGNIGSYDWFVPAVTSQECLVRVSASPVAYASDTSDAALTVFQCLLRSDANGDCVIDIQDFAIMAEEWLTSGHPFYPDFDPVSLDDDGDVDTADFILFSNAWLSKPGDENWNPKCDLAFPPNNIIDLDDFAVFVKRWNTTNP